MNLELYLFKQQNLNFSNDILRLSIDIYKLNQLKDPT